MSGAYRTNPAPVPLSCAECAHLDSCGGWDDERRSQGCFQKCSDCFHEPCDYTCPANPILFAKSVDEVGGFGKLPDRLKPVDRTDFPGYIPQIYHGSRRAEHLKEDYISVPIHHLCRFNRRGELELKYCSKETMLSDLKVSPGTNVIITCVAKDHWIEALYERRKWLLPALSQLEPVAVTVPNFSFVRYTPRTNSIWNQTKGFRVMEGMQDAGLPTIPHLQAETIKDWDRLGKLFTKFPDCRHACMEFQTGLNHEDPRFPLREVYKRNFEIFQQSTSGRIHPVVLAGYKEIGFLSGICRSFSVIDANVFLKTVNRQVAISLPDGKRTWRKATFAQASCLSTLLKMNIDAERGFLFRRYGLRPDGRPINPILEPAA